MGDRIGHPVDQPLRCVTAGVEDSGYATYIVQCAQARASRSFRKRRHRRRHSRPCAELSGDPLASSRTVTVGEACPSRRRPFDRPVPQDHRQAPMRRCVPHRPVRRLPPISVATTPARLLAMASRMVFEIPPPAMAGRTHPARIVSGTSGDCRGVSACAASPHFPTASYRCRAAAFTDEHQAPDDREGQVVRHNKMNAWHRFTWSRRRACARRYRTPLSVVAKYSGNSPYFG